MGRLTAVVLVLVGMYVLSGAGPDGSTRVMIGLIIMGLGCLAYGVTKEKER